MASNQQNRSSQWRGPRNPSRPSGAQSNTRSSAQATGPNRIAQWRQTYERYKALAESTGKADAVERENYWQHAEHYIRLINEATAVQNATQTTQ